jgi:2-keto-4-pentenoate hydratase
MTLAPGDVLALGAAWPAPRVRSGQTATIEIDGLSGLTTRFMDAAA